jgi:leukotriene-A4 hydrolase
MSFYELALRDHTSRIAKVFASEATNWVVGEDGTGVIKGRMKFCRPVFRAVYKVDGDLAVSAFRRKRDAFHPIARKLIEKVRYLIFCSCV